MFLRRASVPPGYKRAGETILPVVGSEGGSPMFKYFTRRQMMILRSDNQT